MKKEQVIELASKAGLDLSDQGVDNVRGFSTYNKQYVSACEFAKLVEQAALDRAAEACIKLSDEMIQDDHREGCIDCSYAIRNLAKESQ